MKMIAVALAFISTSKAVDGLPVEQQPPVHWPQQGDEDIHTPGINDDGVPAIPPEVARQALVTAGGTRVLQDFLPHD